MFIQVIQGRVADADELQASMQRWMRDIAPHAIGWLGSTAGVTADGTAIALARFESADAAQRNGERPEQHQWWMETAKLFAGDVAFHDCRQVELMGAGGSDEAGFVQVIQGRFTDADRARDLMSRAEEPLRRLRPEVLGGVVALHGDDRFTQAVYFTSEADARAGERREPPPDVKANLDEFMGLMQDVTFYDLTHPWLDSPRR